ncbi:oxidoreductase [Litchfieldia salsa]|uniref:Uncharacterized conserved protein YbjT, contains NAD(P)-binding and DUF2867 domains n=1 Tax=Litchfieldia salsa TaxID=930152 RepID=A0A1H0UT88_9BACI|nr:oxidoreductase [Litchfieldia salsa]SDP69424.1 Uncharacterized conserved protein YbjT, contains NAD(P)-binding and DUF2867 domains [Litchfieldia salsa]
MGKKALIAGASGLVGRNLLEILVEGDEYEEIIAIVRTPLSYQHPKLKEHIVNFDELSKEKQLFSTVDHVYCCLGTTIKKAGSKEVMYKIDVEYPLELAELSRKEGVSHFILVSSMNANPNSPIWYSKMKGELEQKITQIPFQSISIIRPSLLMGNRQEFRLGEKMAEKVYKTFSFLFHGPLRKIRGIEARKVALAMYKIAKRESPGITIYPSEQLEVIANK